MDTDRPKRLGGRVIFRPVGDKLLMETRWVKQGEQALEFQQDFNEKVGLLDLNRKSPLTELKRASAIYSDLYWLTGLGFLEEAKRCALIGLELLHQSIKKRQTRTSELTVYPKNIEFHRLLLEHDFNMFMTGQENHEMQTQLYELAKFEHDEMVKRKANRYIKMMKYLCSIRATRIGKFDVALDLMTTFNRHSGIRPTSDIDFAVHETYLQEKTLSYLANCSSTTLSDIERIFKLFFNNIDVTPSRTLHTRNARPIWPFWDAAYIYFKYIQQEMPFDFVMVIQSPFYGLVGSRVTKE
jgi:hypothetical protein